MDLFGGTVEDFKQAALIVVDAVAQRIGEKGGSLIAEEGGVVDAILGRFFATLNGAEITVTIQNNEIKARLTFAPKQGE
jgi:uncharacterized protein YqgC (DUF456 family)